jgi:hypothetical protein
VSGVGSDPLFLRAGEIVDPTDGGSPVERKNMLLLWTAVACLSAGLSTSRGDAQAKPALGLFEGHADVGKVLHPGSVVFDEQHRTYTVTGSGENMWFASDAFHFTWKKVAGDAQLSANIAFEEQGGNAHRKAVLMIRESLDPDSAYVDLALHGNGLTSLQYRDAKGAMTHEVQSNISAPARLRLEKRGQYFYMLLGEAGENLRMAGGSVRVSLEGSFYIGIGVCSHDKDVVEKAVFSNVDMVELHPARTMLFSMLETVAIASTDRRVMYVAADRFEAPNWTRDGAFLFNQNGRIRRLLVSGGKPDVIDTGFANRCNNDHGISPDGKWLAISDQSQGDQQSLVYIVPITGGTPRRITQKSPSYWHGWSPDGTTLVFVGQRDGEFDIYAISVAGGIETQLTTVKGLDDGPEYSPDGKYIYFNSERTGHMQIWRMRPDGNDQEQVTHDELNNWFPHISPDGQWMVFLTYDRSITGHPENKDVMLRLMSLQNREVTVLAKLFGGQGTINVPSWSPDSTQVAFVSYQPVAVEGQGTSGEVFDREK